MIQCVAFDLDGVVIPSGPSFEFFERRYAITRDDFRHFFSGPYRRAMTGSCDLYDVLPQALVTWNWRGTMSEFLDEWLNSCCECDPEMVDEIEKLKAAGIRCCLATNQDSRRAAFLDGLAPLRELFADRYFSCYMQTAKPDPDYFERIQSSLKLAGREILFVDDKQENIDGAIACGWHAALCRDAGEFREILSLYQLNAV
jgi:putative hydrolase of the HAD superfamily